MGALKSFFQTPAEPEAMTIAVLTGVQTILKTIRAKAATQNNRRKCASLSRIPSKLIRRTRYKQITVRNRVDPNHRETSMSVHRAFLQVILRQAGSMLIHLKIRDRGIGVSPSISREYLRVATARIAAERRHTAFPAITIAKISIKTPTTEGRRMNFREIEE